MLRNAVKANPGCDGIILGGHGLFTWGRDAARMLSEQHRDNRRIGPVRVGAPGRKEAVRRTGRRSARKPARYCRRGSADSARRSSDRTSASIGHYAQSEDALQFANSAWAPELSQLGTSCPDHFVRTRIKPMFVPWTPQSDDLAATEKADRRRRGAVPRRLRRLLPQMRGPGLAEAARSQSIRGDHPRIGFVLIRQEQEGSAHHERVLH